MAIVGTAHSSVAGYFVAVGVVVFDNTRRRLVELGVRPDLPDSEIRRIAIHVRNACVFAYIDIYPPRHHQLIRELGDRRLAAWTHALAIEKLLMLGADADTVVLDPAIDPQYVSSRLRRKWSEVEVRSVPRSQSIAMAAASIIARQRALNLRSNARGSDLRSPAASR